MDAPDLEQPDPLICPCCGEQCKAEDLRWRMLGTSGFPRQEVCGYCTHRGRLLVSDALLVACPTCGRGSGEVCIVGYSFAVDPHDARVEAARHRVPLDPFHVSCWTCHAAIGQICRRRILRWPMNGYHADRLRAAEKARPCPVCREVGTGRDFPSDDPTAICGYCTNWGLF